MLVGRIMAREIFVRVGWDCLKYFKRGWNRTEGRGHRDFKKGVQGGQEVRASKRTMDYIVRIPP